MPWENNSPLTRLTCLTRSAISTLRSRQRRRRSSSSGVGAFTIAHTRGSPRLYASNARSRASPSILSVLARRRRRDVAIDDGSTTWLSTPSLLQHPMKPEAVETRFLNDDDRKGFSGPLRRLPLELRKARKQRRDVPGSHGMLRHFLAGGRRQRCDQPAGAAEFQRDETGGKMSLDSGLRFGALRYAWHGRLLSDWSQPHSARALVAILLPMGSINSKRCSEAADGVAREDGVRSCPRAGYGKSACPVR